jgi:hypothetical protein
MLMRRTPAQIWIGGLLGLTLAAFVPANAAEDVAPPLPPPRPDRAVPPTAEAPQEREKPSEGQAQAKPEETCPERLTRLGVRLETRSPIQENACAVQDAVLVSSLPDGIAVSPASLMTCPLAEGLVRWTRDVVAAEADRHLQSKPTKLLIGTSYQCRDQRSGGKLSEHAFGNGVDVTGLEFDKRGPLAIEVRTEDSPEAAFQDAVRKGACPVFTTVLGPGSDADHGDHLHLDMRARKGDYRICQ